MRDECARHWPSTHVAPKRRIMHFLKTLFWVLIAVVVALFGSRNWFDVTVNLWGDIQADIKLPVLLLIAFLIGFAPTWGLMRTRLWSHRRRIDAMERSRVAALRTETPADEGDPAL
jgi:lipopolysaccharide assembly protein A